MAIGSLPPWLSVNPGDFVRAAQAGSALGLQVAQAQNRADEFQREQDFRRWSLEQELRQRAAETAARREQAMREFEMANRYRMEGLNARAESLAERNRHNLTMEQRLSESSNLPKIHFGPNGEVLSASPEGAISVLRTGNPRLGPSDYETVSEKIPESPGTPAIPAQPFQKRSLFGIDWLRKDIPETAAVPAMPAHGEQTITRRIPVNRSPALSALPPATPESPSPFKEGALIRSKKDGKTYRVQGGIPVPMEEPADLADTLGTEDENAD